MSKKKEWIVIGAFILLLLIGTIVVLFATGRSEKEEKKDLSTFSAYTDTEFFQTVPTMSGDGLSYTEARDVGDTLSDMQAANAAGMMAVFVPDLVQPDEQIYQIADVVIKRIDEIILVLEEERQHE